MIDPSSKDRGKCRDAPVIVPIVHGVRCCFDPGLQCRRETHDVVVPENGLEFWQAGFRQIRARIHGAVIRAANFERQRIGLRRDD